MARAPSPVTLQAVPNESIAMYRAIISAWASGLKPNIPANGASAAITAPPGTPGAATMQMPSISMKCMKCGNVWGSPLIRHTVRAQHVIFIIEPDRCMVAYRGTQKLAISSLTPFFRVWRSVTGIVAALDDVPSAVR